jgi:hypothetical protein
MKNKRREFLKQASIAGITAGQVSYLLVIVMGVTSKTLQLLRTGIPILNGKK